MILAVPWVSPLRRLQPNGGDGPPPDGGHFYQYFFEREEIEELVAANGFRPFAHISYGTMKTLRDFARAFRSKKASPPAGSSEPRSPRAASSPPPVSTLRKLFWSGQNLAFENPLARGLAAWGDDWVRSLIQKQMDGEKMLSTTLFEFPWWLWAGSVLFAVGVTTLAALYPARRAAK